jgi:hypothetical protein
MKELNIRPIFTPDKTRENMQSPRTLRNESNATKHKT